MPFAKNSAMSSETMFKIYYSQAPEMKFIRDVLGSYDEMSHEVISAISISVPNQIKS